MEITETKKVINLDDKEKQRLNKAYLVLSDIWYEVCEECNDISVCGAHYSCLDLKNAMRIIDDIAEANDIMVVKGE